MGIIYEEKLKCKGTLVVLENRWYISFEEQGPDDRYKKRPFQITDQEMEHFCEQLERNFQKYEQLKKEGNNKVIKAEGGQWIRFGIREGVCLFEQSYPIKKREKLEDIIQQLNEAATKARQKIKENEDSERKTTLS